MHRPAVLARIAAAIGLALLVVCPGASEAATAPPQLVRFVRPTGDTLIQKGTGPIRVIVHTRDGARPTHVDVNGFDVTRLLRHGPGGNYGAILNLDRHLHYGYNDAFVRTSGTDQPGTFDHTRFIVAKRDNSLLSLTSFHTATTSAPLQVAVRETTQTHVKATLNVAEGVSARAYINGRRVDRAFSQQGKRLVVRLGAEEGLHYGRNHIQLLVHKTHPLRHQSSFDLEERTITIGRGAPIASAGRDSTVSQDGFAQFDAHATELPAGWGKPSFRWTITSAPKGSTAKLRNATGTRPDLVPDVPGRYYVRVSVGGKPGGAGAGVASAAQATGAPSTANDTAIVTAEPDIPPAGLRLDTLAPDRSIMLDGKPIAGPGPCCASVTYAVLDRQTLGRVAGGSVDANLAGLQSLYGIVNGYSASQQYLVVLNWVDFGGDLEAIRNQLDAVLERIGAQPLTDAQRQRIAPDPLPGSAVGVPGAPAGSAFVTLAYRSTPECSDAPCDAYATVGGMTGALRLNSVIGKYDFVFTDYVDIDTETNQTDTQFSPSQLTIKVGDHDFTQPNPGGGSAGFHLLTLHAKTLEGMSEGVYATDGANGAEQPSEVQRLANDLKSSADQPERPLVILQAFGAPHGNDGPWEQVAQQIERLGGTRQVFDALNPTDPRPLNNEDAARKGPYAFIGRVNATAPGAEASYSLNGRPGRLRGVLMRARDGGFEPMLTPTAPDDKGQTGVNTELLHVTSQAPQPFPAFKDANGQPIDAASAQAVQTFLGGPDVAKLCGASDPTCDFRKSYYKNYGAAWASIQGDLANAETHKCPGVHEGFTAEQCAAISAQLQDEVSDVAKVTKYFGNLKEAFEGGAGVAALADIAQISATIQSDVAPPAANNTASNVLTMLTAVANNGVVLPPPGNSVAAVFSASFAVAAYFTKDDGSPNLIGPKITTAAGDLGVELSDHYRQASSNLDDVGRLIVSDYGKLTTVASKAEADPSWQADNVGAAQQAFVRAARQTIYERLVPLAYPVMYDLGGSDLLGNARDWYCDGGFFGYDKHLFNEQSDGAQFVGRFPGKTVPSNNGDQVVPWNPLIAVAAEHANGSLHSARINGVPNAIVAKLFSTTPPDGVGLTKLQFFSPRNGFRYLPSEPTPRVVHDPGGDWHSLAWRPFATDAFGPDPSYIINCSDVPDPPGNSG